MMNTYMRFFLTAVVLVVYSGCAAIDVDDGTRVRSVNLTFFLADAVFNGNVASVQYDVPSINGVVVDEGAVLLYFRDQGTWTALPYTFGIESADLAAVDYTVSMGFGYDVRFLEVFIEISTEEVWGDVERRLGDAFQLKAVVIDDLSIGKAGVDFRDYEAVKAYYGLDD